VNLGAAFTLEEPGYVFARQADPEDCVPLAGDTVHIADLLSVMSGLRGNSNKLYCTIFELLIFNCT
jgi:hypothetical protein